jgi:hypothetical protein
MPSDVKNRKTEVYRIYLWNTLSRKDFNDYPALEEILEGFFKYCMERTNNKKPFDIPRSKKRFWLSEYMKEGNIYKLLWNYSKYGKRTKIIDTIELKPTKEKDKSEGDLEKQHIVIKMYPNTNKAIMVFEKIQGGISVSNLEKEINDYMDDNFKDLAGSGIKVSISPIIDRDFITHLYSMERICVARVWVDKQSKILLDDEDLNFTNEEGSLRSTYEVILKPEVKKSLSKTLIEKLLKVKNRGKIYRIVVEGIGNYGPIKLDTEAIKLGRQLEVLLDSDGHIDTEDIFDKYVHFITNEFNDSLVDSFLIKGNDKNEDGSD